MAKQTEQVLKNIYAALQAHGASMGDVVKTTTYSGSRSKVEREDDERATRHTEIGRRGASEEGDKVIRMKWKPNYMTDISKIREVNEMKQRFFPNDPPTSTTVEVKALARPEFIVEIEAVAATTK